MSKQAITEKDKVHEQWYKDARGMRLEKLPEFLRHLSEDYEHDYGTICHAIAAAGIAAMWAVERTPQGGITGFQAGAVMWEIIRNWGSFDEGPKRMLCYAHMLYPQYHDKFQKTITKDTWAWLQTEATRLWKETPGGTTHAEVAQHWQDIINGKVPFGYEVKQ